MGVQWISSAQVSKSRNLVRSLLEWVRDYEKMSVGSVWSGEEEVAAPTNEDHMRDTIDRVVVDHGGDMPANKIDEASPTDITETGDSGTDENVENTVAFDMDDSRGHVDAPGTRG